MHGKVLGPARCFFVEQQILPSDNRHADSFDFDFCVTGIGIFKRHSAYFGNEIDSAGCNSDLDGQSRLNEILDPD